MTPCPAAVTQFQPRTREKAVKKKKLIKLTWAVVFKGVNIINIFISIIIRIQIVLF